MYDIKEYTSIIRQRLSDYRFYHSLCVSESAAMLAQRYSADVEKARVAGILHDAMKESSAEEQLEVIEKAGMTITPLEKARRNFIIRYRERLLQRRCLILTTLRYLTPYVITPPAEPI